MTKLLPGITLAVLATIAVSMLAFATSTVEGRWSVNRLRGSTQVGTHYGATAEEAWANCIAAIPASQATTSQASGQVTHTCQTPKYVATERFTPNPQPVDCIVSDWSAWGQCESGQQSRSRTITTQPVNGGAACPALTESQPCTSVPPPVQTWTKCADEGQRCSFTGKRLVRYGAGSSWTEPREFDGGTRCDNGVFGDPIEGTVKQCQMSSVAQPETPDPINGTAHLTWDAYAASTRFELMYATSENGPWVSVETLGADARAYDVANLVRGTHYWRLTATVGDDSLSSNVVSKAIP